MAKLSTSSVFGDLLVDGMIHGNVTGNLTGNASTATSATTASKADMLTTARDIALGGVLSGSSSFNGSANVTINASIAKPPKSGDWFSGGIPVVGTDGVLEIGKYIDFHNTDASTNDYDVRLQANTSTPCVITLPSGGGTLARTTDNITGNAATATKLATARTLTIGNSGKTFDGSGNVSWTLSEIGAAAASHGTHLTIGTGASNAAAGNHTHSTYATTSTTGTLSNLQTTAKGNLVAAINEVFQSGNNAKQKLVDALVAYGVNCSTSDTWDTLISHVAPKAESSLFIIKNNTLNSSYSFYNVSGTSGSSWKYSTTNGLYTNNSSGSNYEYVTTNQKLNFSKIKSIKITAKCTSSEHASGYKIWATSVVANALNNSSDVSQATKQSNYVPVGNTYVTRTFDVSSWTGEYYLGITRNSFGGHTFYIKDIEVELSEAGGGLGTLEGLMGGGALDIISANSLPASGKENQICVVTNSPTDKYMISSDVQDDDKTGIFCLTSTIPGSITYTSTSKNTTVKYYMLHFSQNNTIVPSYIYKNGNWTPFTNNRIFLLKDGVYVNEDIFGGLTKTITHSSYPVNYSAGTGIYGNAYSSYYTHFISSVNRVNFTNFNKVVVRLKVNTDQYDYSGDYHAYVFAWSTSKCVRGAYMSDAYYSNNYLTNTISPTNKSANMEKFYFTGTWNYYEIDISSWKNTDYLTILIGETNHCPYWYISDIYVY